eukprot:9072096-Prorocentrum_lima.AAC.1
MRNTCRGLRSAQAQTLRAQRRSARRRWARQDKRGRLYQAKDERSPGLRTRDVNAIVEKLRPKQTVVGASVN